VNTIRHSAFELLVSAYPARKGKGRWLKLLQRLLDIKPYGFAKSSRVGKYTIMLDPGDQCDQLFYFGIIGHDHDPLLKGLLRPGDCVIDVGANAGHFTASCANLVGASGSVHSIEANPSLVSRLEDGFRSVPEIRVHHAAAAGTSGQTVFSVATFSGWSSLIPNKTYDVKEQVRVDRITLDDLICQHKIEKVRLLKLDIEGGEFDALRGAVDALSAGIFDYVFTEVEPDRMSAFGWSANDLTALMTSNEYVAVAMKSGRYLKPLSGQEVLGSEACDILYARSCLVEEAVARLFDHRDRTD
jgi:FkbM family methyltransferase